MPLVSYGLLYTYWLSALGGLMIVGGIVGLGLEPSVDPEAGHDDHDHGEHDPEPGSDAAEIAGTAGQAELVGVGAGGAPSSSPDSGTGTTEASVADKEPS
jgi:hypothetical protein